MKTKKNAQMQLSFGMIFSIILIVFFLAFAFFGIRAFLGVQDSAKTAKFLNDFQSYYGKENIVFYPLDFEGTESAEIKYIDLASITENENPFCISNVNGKVKLRLVKDFSDRLVRITRIGG